MTDCTLIPAALQDAQEQRAALPDDPDDYCEELHPGDPEAIKQCVNEINTRKHNLDEEIHTLQNYEAFCENILSKWDVTAEDSAKEGTLVITACDPGNLDFGKIFYRAAGGSDQSSGYVNFVPDPPVFFDVDFWDGNVHYKGTYNPNGNFYGSYFEPGGRPEGEYWEGRL